MQITFWIRTDEHIQSYLVFQTFWNCGSNLFSKGGVGLAYILGLWAYLILESSYAYFFQLMSFASRAYGLCKSTSLFKSSLWAYGLCKSTSRVYGLSEWICDLVCEHRSFQLGTIDTSLYIHRVSLAVNLDGHDQCGLLRRLIAYCKRNVVPCMYLHVGQTPSIGIWYVDWNV